MTREGWTPEDLQRLERLRSRIEAPESPRWTPEALRTIETVIASDGLDRATEDEWWAHIFLAGALWRRLVVKGKVEKRKVGLHFLQGGKKEAKGREALIRVLEQSNLPGFLVNDLAALFDEQVRIKAVKEVSERNSSSYSVTKETRRLEFVKRSKNSPNTFQDWAIWGFMRPSDGKRSPIKNAMRFFGLSRSAVYQALERTEREILAEMKERDDPRLDAYLASARQSRAAR